MYLNESGFPIGDTTEFHIIFVRMGFVRIKNFMSLGQISINIYK